MASAGSIINPGNAMVESPYIKDFLPGGAKYQDLIQWNEYVKSCNPDLIVAISPPGWHEKLKPGAQYVEVWVDRGEQVGGQRDCHRIITLHAGMIRDKEDPMRPLPISFLKHPELKLSLIESDAHRVDFDTKRERWAKLEKAEQKERIDGKLSAIEKTTDNINRSLANYKMDHRTGQARPTTSVTVDQKLEKPK